MRCVEITLRAVPAADLAEWHRTGQQPLEGTGLRWHPEYPSRDTADALGMLVLAGDGGTPPWGLWQIVVGGKVVGDIGFHGPPDPDGCVEIGYNVVPGWRRRGIASRAVALVVAEAAAAGGRTVTAEVIGDNPGSAGALRHNGFRLVEQHADTAIWSLSLVEQ